VFFFYDLSPIKVGGQLGRELKGACIDCECLRSDRVSKPAAEVVGAWCPIIPSTSTLLSLSLRSDILLHRRARAKQVVFASTSSLQVVIVEHRSSFTSFLTSVCAIVGGVFTVAGLLDSIYYTVGQAESNHMAVGTVHVQWYDHVRCRLHAVAFCGGAACTLVCCKVTAHILVRSA
jgi:hypothetical protein